MDPVEHFTHNHTYGGEQRDEETGEVTANEGVGDLSCRVDGKYTYAHFSPDEEELELLNNGGVIELHIIGHPIPPLGLEVVQGEPSRNGDQPT